MRQPKADPVYDGEYRTNIDLIREECGRAYRWLHPVGRHGHVQINNKDYAKLTAMRTVENIVAGHNLYNVWKVNENAEYQQSGVAHP